MFPNFENDGVSHEKHVFLDNYDNDFLLKVFLWINNDMMDMCGNKTATGLAYMGLNMFVGNPQCGSTYNFHSVKQWSDCLESYSFTVNYCLQNQGKSHITMVD